MKKLLLVWICFFSIFGLVWAESDLSPAIEKKMSIVVQKIQDKLSVFSIKDQHNKLSSLVETFKKLENRVSKQNKPVIIFLKESLQKELEEVNKVLVKEEEQTVYTIPNVNMEKVKESWLERHNNVRLKKWLEEFSWNIKLEKTAYNRATHFVNIWNRTHKRKSSDGFYNYDSIKEWFANQWVYFDESKWTAFSENIAFEYSNCKEWDCTDSVLWVLKNWFDFFMSEEKSNWPHYRAVVQPYFSEIGLWIWKSGNKYYLVTHYAVKVLE